MSSYHHKTESIRVRLARTQAEIEAAQHLRYQVFYEECKATPTAEMEAHRRDFDIYDEISDHLIVIDSQLGMGARGIVGTYRLLRQDVAARHGQFYTSDEYDVSRLEKSGGRMLELGRSCVLSSYRTRPVMQLLWRGIADYLSEHEITLMFGCASFHGTNVRELAAPLSYLYHFHLTPPEFCPVALDGLYVNMNMVERTAIDPRREFNALPPLIKGYLRLGATIGEGAVVDRQFNTTDVCIVLPTRLVTSRYLRHYSRHTERPLAMQAASPPCAAEPAGEIRKSG